MKQQAHLIGDMDFARFSSAGAALAYYTDMFIRDVLPEIRRVSMQAEFGYHGISHTRTVAQYGIEFAIACGTDPVPVMLACGLHDCARTHDFWCPRHGPAAGPIARRFLVANFPHMDADTRRRIIFAVVNHTAGRVAPDLTSACLWDADRIRLAWEMGYNPVFFQSDYAKRIAALTPVRRVEYIRRQDDFMIRNHILGRDEIDYRRVMDARAADAVRRLFERAK